MPLRDGFGPVFVYDCLTSSRRWQVYGGRVLLVASLLVGLALIWAMRYQGRAFRTYQELAVVGDGFYEAIISIELVLVLVLVPAVTAGAICQDKMRGGLALMMSTELTDAEIVLGRLASRLAAVLGVLLCSLPVLAFATLLGGIDPVDILSGSLVIVGVAVLGTCLALTFSVWATKPHEALMATYATWAVWLLTLLAWSETSRGQAPAVLYGSNPFWLILGRRWFPGASESPVVVSAAFLAGSVIVSAALAALSVWRIRAVTLRPAGRTATRGRRWRLGLGSSWVSLDRRPVLWREWHGRRPSAWGRAIWRVYAVVSVGFVVASLWVNPYIAGGTGGFMVSVGLLLVSVSAATVLAEEQSHGSLDVLLTTPLSTREIVLGKWWGAFRTVPGLAVLPGVLAFGAAWMGGWRTSALIFSLLVVALVLAYGAAVTSIGLATAAWQRRLGRAVALSVCTYLAVSVVYPTIVLMHGRRGPFELSPIVVSPFFGIYSPVNLVQWRPGSGAGFLLGTLAFYAVAIAAVAFGLRWLTVRAFDRLWGRVPESKSAPSSAFFRMRRDIIGVRSSPGSHGGAA